MMNRRQFLKAGTATAVAAGGAWAWPISTEASRSSRRRSGSGRPRNVIVMVSDGMSSGTLSITDQFLRWRDGRPSNWIKAYELGEVTRGLMETASLDNIVTDSAAAASAWGCGKRVNNGAVNLGPDGEPYEPILVTARRKGKATGLITTATVTHATPAGFAANIDRRWREGTIATQYVEREIDLLLGGGRRFFTSDRRGDGRDLVDEFKQLGHAYVEDRESLEALADAVPDRLLGLFAPNHLPFDVDRLNQPELKARVPSLAEMLRAGLAVLDRRDQGFILQVEGARVDHAAHANDIAGLIHDQVAFDDAIGVALAYAEQAGDTLVILCTDHGNANPGLSSGENGGDRNFQALSKIRASNDGVFQAIGDQGEDREVVVDVLHEWTGQTYSEHELDSFQAAMADTYRSPYYRMQGRSSVLGQLIANHTDIGWVGHEHTSDHVELAAYGPGREAVKAFTLNTDLYDMMRMAL